MEILDSRSKHKMESLEENSHQQLRRWEKVEKGLAQGVTATSKGGMGEDKEGRGVVTWGRREEGDLNWPWAIWQPCKSPLL